jgi:hypothetical protein
MAKTPSSKAKSSKKSALPVSAGHSPAIELATRLDELRIRERADRGGPAAWPRTRALAARHHELQREAH